MLIYKIVYVKIWPNSFDKLVSQSHALSLYYCLPHPSMAQANYVHVSVDSSLLPVLILHFKHFFS